MKDFKDYQIKEEEKNKVKGGGEWYPGGCSNGGGTQWEGSPGDGVTAYDPTLDMVLIEFPLYEFP